MDTSHRDAANPVRDDCYYLESVILHVEGELFKIPRKYCERMFGQILQEKNTQGDEKEGERPVYLSSMIKKLELQSLLAATYPSLCPSVTMTHDDWELALKLSTMLEMEDVRSTIIKKLDSELSALEKIRLGKTYSVVAWILEGLEKLAEKPEPISIEEGETLGSNTLARLCQIRERAYRDSVSVRSKKNKSFVTRIPYDYDYRESIQKLFVKELEDAGRIPSSGDMLWQVTEEDANQSEPCGIGFPRNEIFYLDHTIFSIQNRLFQIPRICFEQADIFRTTFSLPAGHHAVDGTDDEHPFKLFGVYEDDFRALLKVMYPNDSPLCHSTVTNSEWLAALKLSTMWEFQGIRKLAISELSQRKLGLINKAVVALQCKIPDWFLEACDGLAKRAEGLTVAEAQELGLEAAIKLYQIREEGDARRQKYVRMQIHPSEPCEECNGEKGVSYKIVEGKFDRGRDSYKDDIRREFAMELGSWFV